MSMLVLAYSTGMTSWLPPSLRAQSLFAARNSQAFNAFYVHNQQRHKQDEDDNLVCLQIWEDIIVAPFLEDYLLISRGWKLHCF